MEFSRRKRINGLVGMAPMIDVVFLLLIFFLLTSRFVVPHAIDLELPVSRSTTTAAVHVAVVITIGADRDILIDGQHYELMTLSQGVISRMKRVGGRKVQVEADARVPVQLLVDVLDVVREAGGFDVELTTRRVEVQP